jgi:hypothetical protein
MKTIYLKANTKEELIADIQKVLPKYNGEIEFGNGEIFGHYIGDLMLTPPVLNENFEVITPAVMAGFEHANLLVPDEFDESIFETNVVAPNNPKHKFA